MALEQEGNNQTNEVSTNPELGIKRVRTFAEDLALAKEEAGVTDDEPVEEKKGLFGKKKTQKTDSEALGEKESEPTKPAQKAPQQPSKSKTSPDFDVQTIQQELAKSGIVTENTSQENKKEPRKGVSPIKTYKNDLAESVEKGGSSAISIAAAEANRRAKRGDFSQVLPDKKNLPIGKSILYTFLSIVLVIAGVWGGFYFYTQSKIEQQPNETRSVNLLFVNETTEIVVGPEEATALLNLLEQEARDATGGINDIAKIEIQKQNVLGGTTDITAQEFLERIGGVPGRFTRSLEENFVLGVHTTNKKDPILLFKTNDFDATFAGVLDWEPVMSGTLSPLFGDPTGGTFQDVIVKNKDTRQLKNNQGETVLMYGFPNTETLVITTNEATFFEVFDRLSSSRTTSNR